MISDDDLLEYVNPATAADLPQIRRLERAAVAHVEEKTGYQWRLADTVVETVTRRGDIISLGTIPEDGVIDTLESWDGTGWVAVDVGAYYVEGSFVRLQGLPPMASPFPTRFRATYPSGYDLDALPSPVDTEGLEVPENVKQAVLMYVTYWYDKRDGSDFDQLERAASALLAPMTRQTI